MTNVSRCVLYARKSTDTEDKQILSIPSQLTELRRFAERQGLRVDSELSEACSAREPGRPVFSALLKDIEAGKVAYVLCWKLDRLARNPVDGGQLIHLLGKSRLEAIVTPEGTYTGTGDSKFMLSVLFGAATKMTDDLSVAVKRGNRAIYERGRVPANPPIGYTKVRDPPGFRGAGKVVADPERFPLVQRVWREVLSGGVTVSEVWRRATTEWGLTSRPTAARPSRPPTLSGFYQFLASPFYCGEIVREDRVYPGEHEPMVTRAEFDRVQELIRNPHGARPAVNRFVYAGLMHCGHCGWLMTGETVKNRQGRPYTYYRCGRRRKGYDRCYAPAPSEAYVTDDLEAAICEITVPAPLAEWSVTWIDWWAKEQRGHMAREVEALRAELARLEERRRRLTDLVADGTMTAGDYVEQRATTDRGIAAVQEKIADPAASLDAWRKAVTSVVELGSTMEKAFRLGSQDERRRLLTRLYANILVTERKAVPELRPEYALLADVQVRPNPPAGTNANSPDPSSIPLGECQNARPRSDLERALQAWCTRLWDVRTHIASE